jgi:hypothetical protein
MLQFWCMNDSCYLRIMFQKMNLPEYNLKTRNSDKGICVFDIIRKKYIVLTPEEEVRQRFLHFLINEKQYPKGLISVEKELKFLDLKKRTDIVLYNRTGKVDLIVECKAPFVTVSQKAFDQIARYNMNFKAKYLIVTNGLKHYCCKADYKNNTYLFLKDIPNYETVQKQ